MVAQRLGGGVGRLRPQPAVELQAGATGDEEQPPQVHAALGAVLEAGVEVAIDDVIAPYAQRPPHEVEIGAPRLLLQPGAQGELQAALELRRRLRRAGEDLDRADVGERVREHLGVVELLAERERLGVPGGGLLRVLRRRVEVTEVGVGERQLAPAGQSLEAGHGLEADLGGLLGAPHEAVQPRERAQAVALRERVGARAAQRQGALLRGDRRVELADEVPLVGPALEQRGLLLGRQRVGVAQRPRVLSRGFAVRPERRGARGRRRREGKDRRPVARDVGVMGDAGRIRAAARLRRERRGGRAMQRHPAVGRQRLLDGEAGELVTEGDAVALGGDDARRQALVQAVELGGRERLEQPDLGLRCRDRDRLEQAARGRREPREAGEHRVAHGVRDLARVRGEHLGDVERVAVGLTVKLARIDRVRQRPARRRPARRAAGSRAA